MFQIINKSMAKYVFRFGCFVFIVIIITGVRYRIVFVVYNKNLFITEKNRLAHELNEHILDNCPIFVLFLVIPLHFCFFAFQHITHINTSSSVNESKKL